MNSLEKLTKKQLIEMIMTQGENLTKAVLDYEQLKNTHVEMMDFMEAKQSLLDAKQKQIGLMKRDLNETDKGLIKANSTITDLKQRLNVAETLGLALAKTFS